jgi:hypothetical protein
LATIIAAICCLWSRCRTIKQAELALAARTPAIWLDPKVLGGAMLALSGRDLRRDPLEDRKYALAKLLCKAGWALRFNDHIDEPGDVVFRHACKLGFEGIVSKRLGSPYVSGRSRHWVKSKNPAAPAVKRETEEDWGRERWR